MQCPSCQFENMPGSGRCARCGGFLALATAAIDVNPPRATRLSRRMPRMWGRFWSLRRSWANIRSSLTRPIEQLFSRFENSDFRLGTIVRAIVPGWAHRFRGNSPRAIVFFVSYLALLLPALLYLGTGLGSVLLGLAFGMHVAAASDGLVSRFARMGDRLIFTFACAAILALVLYIPIGRLVARVAIPIQLNHSVEPFLAGDVLWYKPAAQIAPGDVVLYSVPETTITGYNNHTRYVFRDRSINRVAASGGQRVQWKDGKLIVDGDISPWQFAKMWGGETFEFVVPNDRVFIPPDSLATEGAALNAAAFQRLSLVPRSSVDGRIFFRSHPLWRISTITGAE